MRLTEVVPKEYKLNTECIWCTQNAKKNRAHIISKKLTRDVSNAPILKFSVCAKCNTKCGKLEEWVLARTPLQWIKLMLYVGQNSKATSEHIPSYYFSSLLNEWIVFNIFADKDTRNYHHVKTQLIITQEEKPIFISMDLNPSQETVFQMFKNSLEKNSYILDTNQYLPKTFSPRLLLHKGKVILIVHDKNQIIKVKNFMNANFVVKNVKRLKLNPTNEEEIHFKWSRANWARFCAKSAFEALCLFEGGKKCLKSSFNQLRKFVLEPLDKNARDIIFDKKGPKDNSFFYPIHLDLTNKQNAPTTIKAILPESIPGTHDIILYEVDGWIVTSVIFAGFPPVVLILGGPNESLNDMHIMSYNYQSSKYQFYKTSNSILEFKS